MQGHDEHCALRHGRQPVHKAERITQEDFDGESRRHGRLVVSRAKAMAGALESYLKAGARRSVRRIIQELRSGGPRAQLKIEKSNGDDDWDDDKLLKIIMLYGIRQIVDSGREVAGSKWFFTPSMRDSYLFDKEVLLQRIPLNLRKDMRTAVGRALGTWFIEEPELTIGQISNRLRNWLTVSSAAETPFALKPLGKRFTSYGLAARARTIARTEINQARNRGRKEAGKILGTQYWIWVAETDGLSGDRQHDALDGQIRPEGELFVNPATGESLEYPGDPGADASEIINCRCSVRPLTAAQAKALGYGAE